MALPVQTTMGHIAVSAHLLLLFTGSLLGLTTVVADGHSGLLVDGHDPRDWAAALRRLIDDPDLTARLGRGALAHARDFSWERTAERTLDAYRAARTLMRDEMTV